MASSLKAAVRNKANRDGNFSFLVIYQVEFVRKTSF
jgi:hypothetical protein